MGAAELHGGRLKGRGQSLVEVAGVESGGEGPLQHQPYPLDPLYLQLGRPLLQVEVEAVRLLDVLQERPCGREEAVALLADEIRGLFVGWGDTDRGWGGGR